MFSSARDRIFLFTRLGTVKHQSQSLWSNDDTASTVSSSLVIKELLST